MIGKNQKALVRNLTKWHLLSLVRIAIRTLSLWDNYTHPEETNNKQNSCLNEMYERE